MWLLRGVVRISLDHKQLVNCEGTAAISFERIRTRNGVRSPSRCDRFQPRTARHLLMNELELTKQLAATQSSLNIVWTLVTGYLVMFMQAGFALVETGLTRAKNVAHTMAMNFLVYAIAVVAFWSMGFALQMGGVGPLGTFGNDPTLGHELVIQIGGKEFGLFGLKGFFLTPDVMTSGVAALFLFQVVFM